MKTRLLANVFVQRVNRTAEVSHLSGECRTFGGVCLSFVSVCVSVQRYVSGGGSTWWMRCRVRHTELSPEIYLDGGQKQNRNTHISIDAHEDEHGVLERQLCGFSTSK